MEDVSDEVFWTEKIKQHWKAFLILVITGICFFVGLILVFFGYIEESWVGGGGSWTFNEFSVGTVLLFMIQVIVWDIVLVVIPFVTFFVIFGYLWWKRLPESEKNELKRREERQKSHKARNYGGGGGGLSFFIGIVFLIIIFIDGKWLVEFGTLNYSYFIYTYFIACLWILIVIGIPLCIIIIIWLSKK